MDTGLKLQDSRNAISNKELMIGARMEWAEDDRRPPHSPRELTVMCPGHYGCLHKNRSAGTLSVFEQECK